jgi:polysaccharide chain length determinant protein (PEP-CTERM system associated)
MSEEMFEQIAPEPIEMGRYLGIVKRRHMSFLIVLLLGWAAIWGASWILPARYKSVTTILVEQPTMPKNYVEPNVADNLQDRLQSITQQILSRTRLLAIINKLSLYNNADEKLTPDDRVDRMRKDIGIELVHNTQNGTISAFRVTYTASNPRIAQQVTGELTNLFINENLAVQQQQSENTTQFLQNQLAIARSSLADQDAKVRAFQSAHEGSLPTQEASNLQILSGLQSQLQNEQSALNDARQQRVYDQSMIDQYRALQVEPRGANGAPGGISGIDQQLDSLRAKLAALSPQYTDRYPAVVELKSEIAKLEKTRSELLTHLNQEPNQKNKSGGKQAEDVAAVAQSGALLQFESQLKSVEMDIANREAAIASLKARINDYQRRLSEEPSVAQQLADLTRGYEQSQANYNDLVKKVSDSQMATSMEQMQQGERFSMIDPPSLPLKPDSPNRLKMCGIGAGAGTALGLLLVLLLELRDDRLYSDKEIANLIPIGVICEIPEILDTSEQRRRKFRAVLGWTTAALVICVILSGAAFSYLHS